MNVHEEIDSIQRKNVLALEGISPRSAVHAQGSLARLLERDAVMSTRGRSTPTSWILKHRSIN